MYTQLFANYLIKNNYIPLEKIGEIMGAASQIKRAKLGTLAIDAGYMTAEQVEKVHEAQMHMDKRIGDIAVEMGFVTNEQVEALLSQQQTANSALSEVLIQAGYMTYATYEEALNKYKAACQLDDVKSDDEALAQGIISACDIAEDADKDFYVDYLSLLLKNAIRFIGKEFAIVECRKGVVIPVKHISSQEMVGPNMRCYTAIGGDDEPFVQIGKAYAIDTNEDIESIEEAGLFEGVDEFVEACVGEFLNLQNGLFAVNMSNTKGLELDLTPQLAESDANITISGIAITLQFSFGKVEFIINK